MSDDEDKDKQYNPLVVANQLKQELAEIDTKDNRNEVVEALKDQFIASRLEASSLQEKVKSIGILKLLDKIKDDKLSVNQLVRVIELLNKNTEVDVTSLLGGGTTGTQINIDNSSKTANLTPQATADTKQIKGAGDLLEALSGIQTALNTDSDLQDQAKDIIDITPEKDNE